MKLLIVDDTKLNHVVAKEFIRKSGLDLEIESIYSSDEAIKSVTTNKYDIVLLDIMMPGKSGVDVLKYIKNELNGSDMKIIMYTSVDKKSKLAECFENGATDYISKPIDQLEFISRLKNAIRQKAVENEKDLYILEIKKQTQIIKEAQAQLVSREKLAGIGQLAAGVAHEINNPLGFVVSNFDILQDYINDLIKGYVMYLELHKDKKTTETYEAIDQKISDYIKEIDLEYIMDDVKELFHDTNVGLTRVIKIVKSLRNFSRVDNINEFEPFDVNEGLKTTLTIAKNSIKFIANVDSDFGDISEVDAVGSEINQVFLNIILNAAHAIEEVEGKALGKISIKTFSSSKNVYISIKDSGKGMDEETLKSVFNPFFTTKAVGKGTGLGLSISYDIIVNKHKGDIKIDSKVGIGTEFIISIPIQHEES